jgi:hypothetical protein
VPTSDGSGHRVPDQPFTKALEAHQHKRAPVEHPQARILARPELSDRKPENGPQLRLRSPASW